MDAEEAGEAFATGQFARARDLLQSVKKQRDTDPKVVHNMAINKYAESGYQEPKELLAVLEKLKQRLEDARTEADSTEGSALGDTLSDADASLIMYNTAVLQYQLKQYASCRTVLEDMFSNVEPIDELLAFKVCFLLLDVYLLQRQPDKAVEVLAYLERSYLELTRTDGAGESVDAATGAADSKQQLVPGRWPREPARRPPTEILPEEVRSALNLYKAKLSLMSRSSKSSKREIKTALNACTQNTSGLFLKSNLEYLRLNFRKAIKLLNNSCQKHERDANLAALYFNNMGCIHHCMRRHNVAAFYFRRALLENDRLYGRLNESASLYIFSCDRRCEIEFNRALQLLFGGRPTESFAAFRASLPLLHTQPRVWLRLGEACVAQHILNIQRRKRQKHATQLSPFVSRTAGAGENRRLVLPTNADECNVSGGAESLVMEEIPLASDPVDGAIPSLAFGVKCFQNAVQLCEAQLGSIAAADYSALQMSASQGTLLASEEMPQQLHIMLRLSLLQLAWCALLQEDFILAVHYATQLLTDECPANLKLYAHLYTADAMCHINRSNEALEHLSQAMQLGELTSVVSSSGEVASSDVDIDPVRNPYHSSWGAVTAGVQSKQPTSKSPATVTTRALLYANLATVHMLRDNVKAAVEHLEHALSIQPDSRQVLLCLAFLELKSGNNTRAVDILKKHRAPSG